MKHQGKGLGRRFGPSSRKDEAVGKHVAKPACHGRPSYTAGGTTVRLTHDTDVSYRDRDGFWATARVRIYEPEDPRKDHPIVLATRGPYDDPSPPVTGDPERVASAVLERFGLPFPIVFVEHNTAYDPPAFHLVRFDECEVRGERLVLRGITWRTLDQETVEALVGETV